MVESQDVKIWLSKLTLESKAGLLELFHPNVGETYVERGNNWDSVYFLTTLLQAANPIFQYFIDCDTESLCTLHATYMDSLGKIHILFLFELHWDFSHISWVSSKTLGTELNVQITVLSVKA